MAILEDNPLKKVLLLLSSILFVIGTCGSPLTTRLYFLHGGNNLWLSGWLQTAGFPIILIPLAAAYIYRRLKSRDDSNAATKFFLMDSALFSDCFLLGIISSFNNFLYSIGSSKLPVSTSSLILATQLIFVSGFAHLLVKQKFTVFSISSVVFLTVGACILPLQTASDLPEGVTGKEYVMGFVAILAMSALAGLYVPLAEMVIGKANQAVTYALLMEISMVICFSATFFSTIGMLVGNGFTAVLEEARGFELGEVKYYVILVSVAVTTQSLVLGTMGVIFYGSSLFCGITNATLLPVTEILGVILYRETFQVTKIIALFLSLLGFASYFYGETQQTKEEQHSKGEHQASGTDTTPFIQDV